MVRYKIGYNFDKNLIDFIADMNSTFFDANIEGVYASAKDFDRLTARPKFRLPDITIDDLKEHIKLLHKINVKFYYAINSSYLGNKRYINDKKEKIIIFLTKLQQINVDGVIVTHPLIAELVRNNTELPISISSIANIFSVNQMSLLHEQFGCKSFCLSPYFNRRIGTLKKLQNRCALFGGDVELLVNELCGLGYGCHAFSPCIYREACFDCHSENETMDDADLLNGFPQSICMENRSKQGSNFWAKTMVIRPEDVLKYHELGINKFKITGRTATSAALKKVIYAYMTFKYEGDLAQLWYMKEDKETISNKRLGGLIDHWFNNPNLSCDNELCGITCDYCDNFLSRKS